jgi:hypothetical protein
MDFKQRLIADQNCLIAEKLKVIATLERHPGHRHTKRVLQNADGSLLSVNCQSLSFWRLDGSARSRPNNKCAVHQHEQAPKTPPGCSTPEWGGLVAMGFPARTSAERRCRKLVPNASVRVGSIFTTSARA